jgi:hypothetical protein
MDAKAKVVGEVVGIVCAFAIAGLGNIAKSRMRRASSFVAVIHPAILAVTARREPVSGTLVFIQRLLLSKKQMTENCIGPDWV